MELTITSMTPADRLYAYNQSSQLEGQTGCIGHLRGVMLVIFSSIIVHVLSFSLVGFAPIWPFPVPANIRGGEFARCY